MADGDELRLTPDQRARLRPDVDSVALERLLSALPAAVQGEIVGWFLESGDGETAGWPGLNLVGDPELERLFTSVWKSGRGNKHQLLSAAERAVLDAPVTLVLVAQLRDVDALAALWRRPWPEPREMILLPIGIATGAVLEAVLAELTIQRWQTISSLAIDEVSYIRDVPSLHGLREPFRGAEEARHQILDNVVRSLHSAEFQEISGLGRQRAQIYHISQ